MIKTIPCFFTDHLKLKIVNETTCRIQEPPTTISTLESFLAVMIIY